MGIATAAVSISNFNAGKFSTVKASRAIRSASSCSCSRNACLLADCQSVDDCYNPGVDWYTDERSLTYTATYPNNEAAAKDAREAASHGWRIKSQERAAPEDVLWAAYRPSGAPTCQVRTTDPSTHRVARRHSGQSLGVRPR